MVFLYGFKQALTITFLFSIFLLIEDVYQKVADCMLHMSKFKDKDPDDVVHQYKLSCGINLSISPGPRRTPRRTRDKRNTCIEET